MKEINLSSSSIDKIDDLKEFIYTKMKNNDHIRSIDYKNKIYLNFNISFKKFLVFFCNKNSCDINDKLKFFLAPWWLQAVLLKMDREILAENIIDAGAKILYVNDKINFFEFDNHTQIKDEIGNNDHLNNFILALILKKKIKVNILHFKDKKEIENQKKKKTSKKAIFLNNLILLYLNSASIFKKNEISILSDTSFHNRLSLIKQILFCNVFPILQLSEDNIKHKKIYMYRDLNIDDFLFDLFSSKNLLNIFNNNIGKKIAKNIECNNFISHKGYLNYLDIRSTFEKLRSPGDKLVIYSHGGLFDALWTEEEITSKIVSAKWLKSNNEKINKKYFVRSKKTRGSALISLFGHSKYVSRFRSGMTHFEYIHEYLSDIKSLLDNIDTAKRNYILRLPLDRDTNIDLEFYRAKGFILDSNRDIRKTLSQINIHIPTYNATLPYYSLLNNIPSIFFWRDNHFPLPNKFDKVTNKLKEENILFEKSTHLSDYLNDSDDNFIETNWEKNFNIIREYKLLIT